MLNLVEEGDFSRTPEAQRRSNPFSRTCLRRGGKRPLQEKGAFEIRNTANEAIGFATLTQAAANLRWTLIHMKGAQTVCQVLLWLRTETVMDTLLALDVWHLTRQKAPSLDFPQKSPAGKIPSLALVIDVGNAALSNPLLVGL